MEAKRLYTLKDLKVGQVLTEITRERLVNINTIEQLIYNGVKYIVK
jgi:hypothetical protein